MSTPEATETEGKDLPLREDIRLLGRILGDTVREQAGEAVFEIVEHTRQSSVRFRRDEDVAARRKLETTKVCGQKEAILIIRAFGFFSHLANIAEDQHHIRRPAPTPWLPPRRAKARWRLRSPARDRPESRRRNWPRFSLAPWSCRC